jgi:hypothetical protein
MMVPAYMACLMSALLLTLPDGTTKTGALKRRTMAGRSADCELQLKFGGISRQYIQLIPGSSGQWLAHAKHPIYLIITRVEFAAASSVTGRVSLDYTGADDFAPGASVADIVELTRDYEKLRLAQLLSTKFAGGADHDAVLNLVPEFCRSSLTLSEGVVVYREHPDDPLVARARGRSAIPWRGACRALDVDRPGSARTDQSPLSFGRNRPAETVRLAAGHFSP